MNRRKKSSCVSRGRIKANSLFVTSRDDKCKMKFGGIADRIKNKDNARLKLAKVVKGLGGEATGRFNKKGTKKIAKGNNMRICARKKKLLGFESAEMLQTASCGVEEIKGREV